MEAQSFALNKPRVSGWTRASLHGERTTKRRVDPEPPHGIEPCPIAYRAIAPPWSYDGELIASAVSRRRAKRVATPELRRQRRRKFGGIAGYRPRKACLQGRRAALPHDPLAGQRGIEPRPTDLETVRPPWPLTQLRRVRGSNSSHSIDNRAATPVASRGIHRVPGENRTRTRWLRRPASDHRQRLGVTYEFRSRRGLRAGVGWGDAGTPALQM